MGSANRRSLVTKAILQSGEDGGERAEGCGAKGAEEMDGEV